MGNCYRKEIISRLLSSSSLSSSSSSSSFISLCVTTNFKGYGKLLGEESSRNHQSYRRDHLDITISYETRNTYLEITLAQLGLVINGIQVKPCRSGLRTGWVTNREYPRKGPYVVLSFLLFLFFVFCGVIVKSVLKSIFSIISASGFRIKKNKAQIWQCSSHENYYTSGRSTELKRCALSSIYRRGNRQTNKFGFSTV